MKETAINRVYVVTDVCLYIDFDLTVIDKVFQSEDEAKKYCERKNKEVEKLLNLGFNKRLVDEKFSYKEMILY